MKGSSLASIFFDHSRHHLRVRNQPAALDVLQFEGDERLSQPFRYRIEFNSPQGELDAKTLLMQDATFTLRAPPPPSPFGLAAVAQAPLRTLHGVITGFERLSASRDQGHFAVTLEPRLALLARHHQNAIYQQQSVPEIVESILRERHGMRGQDFLFSLTRDYPKREQVMQYGESDLDFISRLLSEVGIWYRIVTDPKLNIDVVEFCDDQTHYQRGLTLPLVAPSGTSDAGVESLWEIAVRHRVVEKSVTLRDYNWRRAQSAMDAAADVTRGDDPTTCGEAYHYDDSYLEPGDDASAESGAFYARLAHERYLNGQTTITGYTNAAAMLPGMDVVATGDAPAACAGGMVITAVHCEAARSSSFAIRFTAIPYSEEYGFRPAKRARPVMAGTIPARVTSTAENDLYGHIDAQGRYRVRFDFDRATWKPGLESMWVQQAKAYAGETYGLHAPLLAGTSVAIAFEKGNPDRPYIAHALHDSRHPEHVTLYNYKRNVWRTPANNKLRMDDTRGEEHIKLATEYGKSQLSLGHLVDAEKAQRGEGFELRSDHWGSIRAAKGLFISADGQPQARGEVLSMSPAISLLKGAVAQIENWQTLTKAHHNVTPDIDSLKGYLSAAEALRSPAMLISAPEGIGMVSAQPIVVQSGQALYAQTAGDAHIASGSHLGINAGSTLNMLAHQGGMRLVSAKGPLEIESHADALAAVALQDISLTSSQGEIHLTAKNGITLACGGAYIRLTPAGDIEIHGPGRMSFKGQHMMDGPTQQDFPLPELPSSVCKACLKMAQQQAQGFVLRGQA